MGGDATAPTSGGGDERPTTSRLKCVWIGATGRPTTGAEAKKSLLRVYNALTARCVLGILEECAARRRWLAPEQPANDT